MDRDAKKMSPEQEVEAAKERLRASLRRVSEELGRGVDEAQQRVVLAARHYLLRWASPPPCRFDVVAIDGDDIAWLKGAFTAH